jgi:Na+:H+ antiporter, NhaA family
MATAVASTRLDRPVDPTTEHLLGDLHAPIVLVEYGSYACQHCRAANERISDIRDEFGDRLLYVFRHRPLPGSSLARRAAELTERAADPEQFWRAHVALMTRSPSLTEDDLAAVASEFNLATDAEAKATAKTRVEADEASARASGVRLTPTFFINGRRYDGPWDSHSFADAMVGSVGHKLRNAALDFASWTPSSGALLLLASVLAVLLTNSMWGPAFTAFWGQTFGLSLGQSTFALPLIDWVNHGLLAIFFLVVGLEIKREFTVGTLAHRKSAALPIAAAIGGMAVPAGLYVLMIPSGPLANGWGVPMATDTAFAVALIAMMGKRVPVETPHIPHCGNDHRRHWRHRRRCGVLHGRATPRLSHRGGSDHRVVGAPQSMAVLPGRPVPCSRRAALVLRARGGHPRDIGRRDLSALYAHTPALKCRGADGAGRCDRLSRHG